MRRRIAKLRYRLWRMGGVDIVVTHAPPQGVGDAEDPAHRGFQAFLPLLEQCKPRYLLHGHVHLNYGMDKTRVRQYGDTQVINVTERYTLELPDVEVPAKYKNQLIWRTKSNQK